MPAAVDQIRQLQRSEADLVASRSILSCLAEGNACPPEWVDEFDRLRAAHYTAEAKIHAQIEQRLLMTNRAAYQKLKDSPFAPRMIPGLAPRLRSKVEQKRTKGTDPSNPDAADLVKRVMRLPPHWGEELPVDQSALALELVREQTQGYGVIWPYFVAVGIASLVTYLILDDDPTVQQMEVQADEYARFLSTVGPVLQQVGSGLQQGTISQQQAALVLGTLSSLCPAATLPDVPGASTCGFGSCVRYFALTAVVGTAVVLILAASRGAFNSEPRLPPVERDRGRVVFPRARPKLLPARRTA